MKYFLGRNFAFHENMKNAKCVNHENQSHKIMIFVYCLYTYKLFNIYKIIKITLETLIYTASCKLSLLYSPLCREVCILVS